MPEKPNIFETPGSIQREISVYRYGGKIYPYRGAPANSTQPWRTFIHTLQDDWRDCQVIIGVRIQTSAYVYEHPLIGDYLTPGVDLQKSADRRLMHIVLTPTDALSSLNDEHKPRELHMNAWAVLTTIPSDGNTDYTATSSINRRVRLMLTSGALKFDN